MTNVIVLFVLTVAGIIRGSTKVAVDIDEAKMQKRLRESRAKKAEKGAGKHPRDDDEGRVVDVLGKRKKPWKRLISM